MGLAVEQLRQEELRNKKMREEELNKERKIQQGRRHWYGSKIFELYLFQLVSTCYVTSTAPILVRIATNNRQTIKAHVALGNAKTLNAVTHDDLLSDTHMTNYQYIIALMVFLIAYAIFEVPSNYFLKKLSPSKWISFLMFSWGIMTIGLGFTHNFAGITAVRFLLGTFEAGTVSRAPSNTHSLTIYIGLFPGLVYYLTFWYRTSERSIRVAFILASATLAGAFGGAIAFGVGHMNGTHGMSAWRWLFIIEGIPSCLSSILVFFLLPDYPETVKWLSTEEKELATSRLASEGSKGHDQGLTWREAKETLCEWRLYAHYAFVKIYFGISTPFSSLSLFTPSITAGLGYKNLEAQLMTVPPYAVAYVVTILVSWSADHFNARALHSSVMAAIGAAGFTASALLPPHSYNSRYGCLIVAASGAFSCIPPLLGFLSSNLFSTASIGLAIALNISVGAPGQIAGVWIYKADQAKQGYPLGHWVNAGLLFFVAVGCVGLRLGRGGGRGRPAYHPVPSITLLHPGVTRVSIVLKQDQGTGREVQGVVGEILTRGEHPRGVKVRLRDGRVGRVQGVLQGEGEGGVEGSGDGGGEELRVGEDGERGAGEGGRGRGRGRRGRGGGFLDRRYGDFRQDEIAEPAADAGVSLEDYVVVKGRGKGKKGGRRGSADPGVEGGSGERVEGGGLEEGNGEEMRDTGTAASAGFTSAMSVCPVCGEFEGDEMAVAHHVNGHFE
ncbi:Major facilitator superfamily domain general substrate transporter protein [Rutstroemia sp. NJR-2017a BBW]|nr:Major facilitator superfamily domain general substrate transporter protein [Rutstroemia sp. NJR-2017a BBW]